MKRTVRFNPPCFYIDIDIPEGVDPWEYIDEWAEINDQEIMEKFSEVMA